MHAEPGTGGQPRVDVSELARVDPGSEDRLDLSFVLPPPAAELVDSAAGKRMELVQEDPDVIGVAMDHVEELVAEHGQLHRRRTAGLGYAPGAGDDLVHHPVVDGGEELLLGADVVVERALAEAVGRA